MASDDMCFSTFEVPEGFLPNILTHLEMTAKPVIEVPQSRLSITSWNNPEPDAYLSLFRKIGQPWLWLSRLLLDEDELRAVLDGEHNEIYLIQDGNEAVGYIELDFSVAEQCEIGFFGLVPALNGQGHGRWLMAETLKRAWKSDIERVWLHTCTLDSPRALGFYLHSGFTAYKRQIEMHRDPRLTGHHPEDAAPQIPLIS